MAGCAFSPQSTPFRTDGVIVIGRASGPPKCAGTATEGAVSDRP